jgi:hypothetical protein
VLLNRTLPAAYYARLETRPEVGIVEDGGNTRKIIPDVAVVRHPDPRTGPTTMEVTVRSEPIRHAFVEIRDPAGGHQLVTLIEIVSPSSKRKGADRRAYLKKQREVLDSDASLIELDFLRTGDRPLANVELQELLAQLEPQPDYLVLVNRASKRIADATGYQLFPISIREALPVIPVPLRPDQEDGTLDLQCVCNRAYEGGPYLRGAVDYTRPPDPLLEGDDVSWAAQRLRDFEASAAPPSANPPGVARRPQPDNPLSRRNSSFQR